MKKYIIIITLMTLAIPTIAQTIHWITFIDTTDKNVGKIDVLGREVLYSHFINEVNAALAPKGYKAKTYDYYDVRCTPENCKSVVENLSVDAEDIILFYYIGHGGRPNTNVDYMRQHPYPQMCLAQHNEQKFIPLEWVDEELRSKGARLSVTIGMCCNSLANISIKDKPLFSPNYGATYMSGNKMKCIQNLFLGYKGSIIATSASPGQTSICFESSLGEIDAYTTVLCLLFQNQLDNASTLDWDTLLDTQKAIIHKNTDGKQTPLYNTSNMSQTNIPTPTNPNVPSQRQVEKEKNQAQQSTNNEIQDVLTQYFDILINPSINQDKRIELERILSKLFAPNAQIRMLSQDGNVVLDREDADVFLGRLSTSRILLKVAVVDGTFDNNERISSLKVREIYKR